MPLAEEGLEEKGKVAILATNAGALLLLFVRLGAYPLLDPDEATLPAPRSR